MERIVEQHPWATHPSADLGEPKSICAAAMLRLCHHGLAKSVGMLYIPAAPHRLVL